MTKKTPSKKRTKKPARSKGSDAAQKSNKKATRKKRTKKPARSTVSKPSSESNSETQKPIAETNPSPKRGRPTGSKTQKEIAETNPSQCPKCQSTDREPYHNVRAIAINGNDPVFGPYTHVVFRSTKCGDCGQARVDRSYENRTKKR